MPNSKNITRREFGAKAASIAAASLVPSHEVLPPAIVQAPAGMHDKRPLFYNYDGWTAFLYGADDTGVNKSLRHLINTQVTHLMLCPNVGQAFICPPNAPHIEMCHLGKTPSPNELADFARSSWGDGGELINAAARVVKRWDVDKYDAFGAMIKVATRQKLKVFISLRLNDRHTLDTQPEGPYSDAFYRDHGKQWGTGRQTLSFVHKEVREHRINQIDTLLKSYPSVRGIELDFLRNEPYCKPEERDELRESMNDFVFGAATVVAAINTKRDKDNALQIMVRVPFSIQACEEIGLDPVTWAINGWVDAITLSHFLRQSADLQIEQFKAFLLEAGIQNVPVYGCLDCLLSQSKSNAGHPTQNRWVTPESYRGIGSALYARGADGLYLYNMYAARTESDAMRHDDPFEILKQLGDPKALESRTRLSLASFYDDLDEGFERPAPRKPADVSVVRATLIIGVPAGTYVLRVVGKRLDPAGTRVKINSHRLASGIRAAQQTLYREAYNQLKPPLADCLDFDVDIAALRPGVNLIKIEGAGKPLRIYGVELAGH
ncbi:MAG TPA: hypothetical protein VFC78_24110 [Tepidisphaeraceae bacterium]|nr:hypothetical protein [Tepidisphaeraceae bacterium]